MKTAADGLPPGFVRFWGAWPSHHRREDKAKCAAKWAADGLEGRVSAILEHVEACKLSSQWTEKGGQFVPAPLAYLNKAKYDAPPPPPVVTSDSSAALGDFTIVDPTPEEAERMIREAFADDVT